MIRPVNNQALIEIVNEYAAVSNSATDSQVGIVRAVDVSKLHLTASTGFMISDNPMELQALQEVLQTWIGKTVRYQLYSDSDGGTFDIDGKTYTLIPWYRIIGVEDGK